ncbi:7-deoxyloganetic acid glucosyltransferase [Gossypium hirsutum]|uniref:7-deoxyloganetic acid glucosyltransferase n=1 Tax=Gossypium hirsutum TaxID=3635 RepID=A0ABM2ZY61_GOSHI|nr:7-deoxyloganetic acid glucosyltransferase-like [Gossypium hirsutum]
MEKAEPEAPHVLILPIPAQGHLKSMLKLAKLLSYASFQITFLNTEYFHHTFLSSIDIRAFSRRFPKFQFVTIPDGIPPDSPRSGKSIAHYLISLTDAAKPAVVEVLVSLRSKSGRPPTCIIADGIILFAPTVLVAPGLTSTCPTSLEGKSHYQIFQVFVGLRKPTIICSTTSSSPKLRPCDEHLLSSSTRSNNLKHPLYLSASIFSKIRTIVPLHCLSNVDDPTALASTKSIFWQEEKGCLTWLDSHPSKSVVFVSFGSVVTFTLDQMLEFWHGLVNSGKPFLWVIRSNAIIGEDDPRKILEDLKDNTKGKRSIVSWAPQEEVLANPAVGAFLTHIGWNSTLESIYAGVPMICWPLFVDQYVNSRCVSHVWRVGFDMKDSCHRSIVEKMVRDVIEMKNEEIMKSMEEISKQAQESVKESGPSYCNLDKMIQDIMSVNLENINRRD